MTFPETVNIKQDFGARPCRTDECTPISVTFKCMEMPLSNLHGDTNTLTLWEEECIISYDWLRSNLHWLATVKAEVAVSSKPMILPNYTMSNLRRSFVFKPQRCAIYFLCGSNWIFCIPYCLEFKTHLYSHFFEMKIKVRLKFEVLFFSLRMSRKHYFPRRTNGLAKKI
jgi:hypothetical protein